MFRVPDVPATATATATATSTSQAPPSRVVAERGRIAAPVSGASLLPKEIHTRHPQSGPTFLAKLALHITQLQLGYGVRPCLERPNIRIGLSPTSRAHPRQVMEALLAPSVCSTHSEALRPSCTRVLCISAGLEFSLPARF